jgi:molecular chaperone Hsp33
MGNMAMKMKTCFHRLLMLQIQFRGDGPLGSILAVADTKGQVKGRVGNPAADPPLRPDGKLNVGAAVGQGTL